MFEVNKGFFNSSELRRKEATPRIARCGLCGLYKHCKSPKMPPTGKGRRKILAVAEAPGAEEDRLNTQLIGRAGQRLRRHLKQEGIDLDRDCWKTNAVICRREGNETPTDEMIRACRPNLVRTINECRPNVILLLGQVAVKSFLSLVWKADVGAISRWGGYCIPCHKPNAWIVPTYHPSYLMRKGDKVLDRLFQKHLRIAVKRSKSKPWGTIPFYRDEVEIIRKPSQAVKAVMDMIDGGYAEVPGTAMAFDYEANCLKPEGEGAELVSCSVCWRGKRTISFPWVGEVRHAVDKLLRMRVPKIASNIKFEDRWTRFVMGHLVRNWWWDTMIAAHVLDNRPGVTGIEFQAFALLGAEPYKGDTEPFLKPKGKSRFNRIRELDLRDLLLRGGLDSLLEYKVAMKQMKLFHERA